MDVKEQLQEELPVPNNAVMNGKYNWEVLKNQRVVFWLSTSKGCTGRPTVYQTKIVVMYMNDFKNWTVYSILLSKD